MRLGLLSESGSLPLMIEPVPGDGRATPEGLIAWHQEAPRRLHESLLKHGAILFRGFGFTTTDALGRFAKAQAGELKSYIDGNSPRTKLSGEVYTSTEYPADQQISLHNELSYSNRWPSWLFFCCHTPSREGGQTPITDGRQLLRALDPEVVEEFTRKQVRYVRNLHGGRGLGRSWQETFETTERHLVEQYLRDDSVVFEWTDGGSLRITQTRPAVITHPLTGEAVWFNQADQFHPSGLNPEAFEAMMMLFEGKEEQLPINSCFGDGSPIPREMLDHVRQTALRQAVVFPWQEGDLLMVDNVLTLHGRMPYAGPRRILACMA